MGMKVGSAGAALGLVLALLAGQRAEAAIEASEAWTRVTPPGVTVAVGYFTLKNTGGERRQLLKITAPEAQRISLHKSSVDANGVSHMWPVGKFELSPGEVRRFEPNGYHLMLEGLGAPLRAGTRVAVTIVFEDEEPIVVQFEVRPLVDAAVAPDPHSGHHDHH
jgi:periplasmic copper chaperone A